MGSFRHLAIAALLFLSMVATSDAQLSRSFKTWTPKGCNFSADGREVALSLQDPKEPYASLTSKSAFLYGSIGAWIKLAPNDSAGTVTTLYLSSTGPKHCEFDFEFLGNQSGEPYLLHTNIFVDGVGGREQQIRLWFDATADYHYYNFQWNSEVVVFFVDNVPIRMYGNYESKNTPQNSTMFTYPKSCPMSLYLSIWDGSQWATQNGRIKLNWAHGPFTAHYKRFCMRGCQANQFNPQSIQACQNSNWATSGVKINGAYVRKLRWVKQNYIHYNYCTDTRRYATPPPECKLNVL